MRKHYDKPEIEILEFDGTDVLTASGDSDTNSDKYNNYTPFEPINP